MTKSHVKRCSTSLIIREMQIKAIMRYHVTLVRMGVIKTRELRGVGVCGCKEKRALMHCWWECKLSPMSRIKNFYEFTEIWKNGNTGNKNRFPNIKSSSVFEASFIPKCLIIISMSMLYQTLLSRPSRLHSVSSVH